MILLYFIVALAGCALGAWIAFFVMERRRRATSDESERNRTERAKLDAEVAAFEIRHKKLVIEVQNLSAESNPSSNSPVR